MSFQGFSNIVPLCRRPRPRGLRRAHAFTFVEVLFAVIVLGIGFIMLAGMFPIAIQQTQTTSQETTGATFARSAINYLGQLANNTLMDVNPYNIAGQPGMIEDFYNRSPLTGSVPTKWLTIEGNMIFNSDPRFAWTALYRRDVGAPYAQVFVFVSQCRGHSQYSGTSASGVANDLSWNGVSTTLPVMLEPKKIQVQLVWNGGAASASWIKVNPSPSSYSNFNTNYGANYVGPSAVNTGNFVVIANDTTGTDAGAANGRIYRIGNPVSGQPNTWELQPGNDMTTSSEALSSYTDAYVIGLDYDGVPTGSTANYINPAPDIGIYTGFVQIQ